MTNKITYLKIIFRLEVIVIKTIKIDLPNSLYQKVQSIAGNSNNTQNIVLNILKDYLNSTSNIEENQFIGMLVTGSSIIKNNDTVILGGSNYAYQIINGRQIQKNKIYQVIDFSKGNIILKSIE